MGKLSDTQSSLTQVGARDYDPALGVFTAPDPVFNATPVGGSSPYAYAGHDPINYSDPSGLHPIAIGIGGLILGAAAIAGITAWVNNGDAQAAMARSIDQSISSLRDFSNSIRHAAFQAVFNVTAWAVATFAPPRAAATSIPSTTSGGFNPAVTASPSARLNFGTYSLSSSGGPGFYGPEYGGQGYGDPGAWLGGGAAAVYGASQAAEAAQRAAAAAAAARAAGLAENARHTVEAGPKDFVVSVL